MEFISKSLEDTAGFAKDFLSKIKQGEKAVVVGLYGNLGAGKTAFVQAVAKEVGIEEQVQSPTFLILKRYMIQDSGFMNLVHVDAYRLERGEEIQKLGWDNLISDSKNLIFVEWPEKISDVMPENHLKIGFEFVDEKIRKISM